MKDLIPFIVGLVFLSAGTAWSQQGSIYDNTYRGPVNYYGQPQFQPMPQDYGRRPPNQSGPIDDGLIFQGMHSVRQLGGYLWSYMPAPLRGVKQQPPSYKAPGGYVLFNYVPGSD